MSLLYRSPALYESVMRLLYGKGFQERYEQIAARIPEQASVLDVCCGDCYLFRHYLVQKNVRYAGLDASSQFEKFCRTQHIPFHHMDLLKQESLLPQADYVIMMGSLYQFMPHHKEVIERMKKAAGKGVLICEPVRNLVQSSHAAIRLLAKAATYPATERFNQMTLMDTLRECGFQEFIEIANGREMLGIYKVSGENA